VLFWILLGVSQSLGGDYVELNVMTVHAEVRSDEVQQAVDPFLSLHQERRDSGAFCPFWRGPSWQPIG
jgi:hypothetical protein